ncbi:MAG: DNA polymerase III subunit gamma/tau, partial [Treponema sp.]|nr:DNA polymerase III subunit gamma/tau [Treponema sp.]
FWIARESTGSMRDAFTLFDQVASFSGGSIREALIREKLGLAGLEKIDELARACALCDQGLAMELVDAALSAGVAIEQLVVDLAGYYRALLLVKSGISRESILGCKPGDISPEVTGALDAARAAQALEILLDCYRDIRYSLSPRFELETAVAKLAWLRLWVTQAEMREAISGAREALGPRSPGGGSQAAARAPSAIQAPASASAAVPSRGFSADESEELSLSQGLRKLLGDKKNGSKAGAEDDEDEPAWSEALRKAEARAEEAPLDRVLRMIPGEIVD